MNTYSVSVVSKMLNVNEETIRRWIRDGKLKAIRAVGRGGNTMFLEDVVDFANKPPRAYLIFLEEWLTNNKIPYERIEDSKVADEAKTIGKAAVLGKATAATVSTITAATIPASLSVAGIASTAAMAGPIGIGVAGVVYGATKLAKRKNQRTYSIRLIGEDDEKQNESKSSIDIDEVERNSSLEENEHLTYETNPEEQYKDEPNEDDATKEAPSSNEMISGNVLDKIAQAKQMLDAGIITQEEFTVIKTRLIERI